MLHFITFHSELHEIFHHRHTVNPPTLIGHEERTSVNELMLEEEISQENDEQVGEDADELENTYHSSSSSPAPSHSSSTSQSRERR